MATAQTIIIAEIGTSHNSDRKRAEQLIKAATASGADRVKFQHFYADEIIHPRTGLVELPGGSIPLYDRFKSLETGPDFLEFAAECCADAGVEFYCTPFGKRSAEELQSMGQTRFKIASPELNHHPLLKQLAPQASEIVLSSGVSTLADIEESLILIDEHSDTSLKTILLHCITAYPAPEEEYNLMLLVTLSNILGIATGISDHSLDPVLVPAISTLAGAAVVEKHFTLDRNDGGLDDPIALPPDDFRLMSDAIREAEQRRPSFGNDFANTDSDQTASVPNMHICDAILTAAAKVSALRECPPARILKTLGDGIKRLAAAEKANYGRSNRSIHILHDREAGSVIGPEDIAILRTEKILTPGMHPRYLDLLPGRTLRNNLEAGEGINWTDIG